MFFKKGSKIEFPNTYVIILPYWLLRHLPLGWFLAVNMWSAMVVWSLFL